MYSELIEYQIDLQNFILLFYIYLLFIICLIAETNRAPFDLCEAEAELVGGYNTEQAGVYFSLIFISEYSSILALSSNTIIQFYGGSLFSF